MFWPPDPDYAPRGLALREELGIADDSPLKSRALRNHFEHLDERLETWEGGHLLFDLNIGPEEAILAAVPGAKSSDIFRHFDAAKAEVVFIGDRFELRPLVQAITALQERLGGPV
jgi:hypothetical protein